MTEERTPGLLRRIPGFGDFDEGALAELDAALEPATIRGGEVLFRAGADAGGLVVTVRGRLAVLDSNDSIVATLGRRQVVGEMGALAATTRTNKVVALRDTEILRLDQATFERLFVEQPELARSLSRLVVSRLLAPAERAEARGVPAVVAVITFDDSVSDSDLAEAFERVASACAIVRPHDMGRRTDAESLAFLDRVETDHDLVVLIAGSASAASEWRERCLRQADSVVVVPPHSTSAVRRRAQELGVELRASRASVEVAVNNPSHALVGYSSHDWMQLLAADRLHQLRTGDRGTADRCARLTTGKGVGLVFSGGAAKGLAHLGAWRALCELGVGVDTIAGVSVGSLVGAGVALDYDPDVLKNEIEEHLIRQGGLADVTFPWVAVFRGEEISRRIRAACRDRVFEQTWRPFACTSCDLTTGETIEHRTGPIWRALRASVSIPGLFPPVRDGQRLLVDGAVRDNLPVATLRRGHPTPLQVIAIDVGKEGFLDPGATPDHSHVSGWSLLAQRVHPRRTDPDIPTMAQVLMRVVDLAGIDRSDEADVLIRPELDCPSLSDLSQIDALELAGYNATVAALT